MTDATEYDIQFSCPSPGWVKGRVTEIPAISALGRSEDTVREQLLRYIELGQELAKKHNLSFAEPIGDRGNNA